jgi:hypothetical protein
MTNEHTSRIHQAIDSTRVAAPGYFESTLKQRTTEPKGSRYEGIGPDELEKRIREADWQPYSSPNVAPNCAAFIAVLPGRLGIVSVSHIPDDAPIYLIDPKKTGAWSACVKGVPGDEELQSVIILGPEAGKEVMYTVHPGAPLPFKPVTELPAEIAARVDADGRIALTKAEVVAIGFDFAKVE